MTTSNSRIEPLILSQLAGKEMRILGLVVGIRRTMNPARVFKGDLAESVRNILRRMVASGVVHENDGLYSLGRASGASRGGVMARARVSRPTH